MSPLVLLGIVIVSVCILYALQRLSTEKQIDIVEMLKYAILAGASAYGIQWAVTFDAPASIAKDMVEEMFTGTPQF